MACAVTLDQLKSPEKLYKEVGCKLVVGMPFKDIATADSIFMREVTPRPLPSLLPRPPLCLSMHF